jgi:hypothetical protein
MVVGGNLPMFGKQPAAHEVGIPYVKVIAGELTKVSQKVAAKTLEPAWRETLAVGKAEGELLIEVWATTGAVPRERERFLGETTVEVPSSGSLRLTKNLSPNATKGAGKTCGQLALEITAPTPGPEREDLDVFGWEVTF